ncbi:BldC family transcriptional regulator [Streptomyces synnematoformans]|uniref:Helix-turn-helix domain-containing protein n=1 Tax=Streptomyces synnematoformans TaxID=415721 RepID=A0ABP5IY20_9ACTN
MSPRPAPRIEPLLTPKEVASLFRVDPRTVTRWAREGRLTAVRTLGGHRRYRQAEVFQLFGNPAWDDAVRSLTDEQGR